MTLSGEEPSHAPPSVAYPPPRAACAPSTSEQPPHALAVPLCVTSTPPAAEQPSHAPPEDAPMLTSIGHAPSATTEPKRIASTTAWIAEAANNARTGKTTDTAAGGARRSVPQTQLPKFSDRPIEWPQWAGLFKTLIDDQPELSDAEKLAHLQSSVTGLAKQTVEDMLFDGSLYPVALQTLMDKFGREENIVRANLSAVFNTPPIRELNPTALGKLHTAIHCAVTVLSSMGFGADLDSTEILRRILLKLPVTLMQSWGENVIELNLRRPNLRDFDLWLERKVRVLASIPKQLSEAGKPPRRGAPRTLTSRALPGPGALTTAPRAGTDQSRKEEEDRSMCTCGRRHTLARCPDFLKKTSDERARAVGESGRCFVCLEPGHRSRHCTSDERCGEDGCDGRHHRTLHGSGRVFPRGGDSAVNSARRTVAVAAPTEHETTLLQIVPIRVHGQNKKKFVDTFALLDSGAQVSLCTEELARKTGPQRRDSTVEPEQRREHWATPGLSENVAGLDSALKGLGARHRHCQ